MYGRAKSINYVRESSTRYDHPREPPTTKCVPEPQEVLGRTQRGGDPVPVLRPWPRPGARRHGRGRYPCPRDSPDWERIDRDPRRVARLRGVGEQAGPRTTAPGTTTTFRPSRACTGTPPLLGAVGPGWSNHQGQVVLGRGATFIGRRRCRGGWQVPFLPPLSRCAGADQVRSAPRQVRRVPRRSSRGRAERRMTSAPS